MNDNVVTMKKKKGVELNGRVLNDLQDHLKQTSDLGLQVVGGLTSVVVVKSDGTRDIVHSYVTTGECSVAELVGSAELLKEYIKRCEIADGICELPDA